MLPLTLALSRRVREDKRMKRNTTESGYQEQLSTIGADRAEMEAASSQDNAPRPQQSSIALIPYSAEAWFKEDL
jgi:hypothetical protein